MNKMKTKRKDFFSSKINIFLFLFIPTVVFYAKSLGYGYTTMDEKWLIVDNAEYLKSWKSFSDAFSSSLLGLYYRPFLLISICIDYKIGGVAPFIYHFTNLLWHLLSIFSLFRLLILFDVTRKSAAFFTLCFALHPMMIHAVVWVPGRNDLMLCVFSLSSMIFLKKYLIEGKPKQLIFNIMFFGLALFTKENAIGLLILYCYISFQRPFSRKFLLLSCLWLAVAVFWLMIRNSFVSISTSSTLSLTDKFFNFSSGLLNYLGKSFFPLMQSVHPINNEFNTILGVFCGILLVILFYRPGLADRKTALTGILIFSILLLLPLWFSSGKNNAELYEHRSYTSICGLILFISQVKFRVDSLGFRSVLALILMFFIIKGSLRMKVYKNEVVFLKTAIEEQPDYYLFQAQYAGYLLNKGDYSSAINYYTSAIKLRPDKHEFYNDRGRSYFSLGYFDKAAEDITSALKIRGFDGDYYLNRCMAYNAANESEKAMNDLYVVIKCCKNIVPEQLKNEVGLKWRRLFREISDSISIKPNSGDLYYRRSRLYFGTGQKDMGLLDLRMAISIDPSKKEYSELLESENKK